MMLFVSTAGSLFPAALILSKQLPYEVRDPYLPSAVEITFCRVNAFVMMILYICYLVFQLGTHKEEFDDECGTGGDANNENEAVNDDMKHMRKKAERNLFCMFHANRFREAIPERIRNSLSFESVDAPPTEQASAHGGGAGPGAASASSAAAPTSLGMKLPLSGGLELQDIIPLPGRKPPKRSRSDDGNSELMLAAQAAVQGSDHDGTAVTADGTLSDEGVVRRSNDSPRRAGRRPVGKRGGEFTRRTMRTEGVGNNDRAPQMPPRNAIKAKGSDDVGDSMSSMEVNDEEDSLCDDGEFYENDVEEGAALLQPKAATAAVQQQYAPPPHQHQTLSMRVAVTWLFIMTLCISALSDILVDTIDGFAQRVKLSEVFTSMVVIPFFANIAEQVSSFLFAYRNEMDLCVGVTIGSAIQIATFVLPGSVLIGMFLDRSMTLYFHGFETVCIFFGVVVVGSILQGGTTNWLVGASK